MIKVFEVENFKSFENNIKIDFTNTRDYKFGTSCIKDGLLNKILVYGKNSVGKTNLGYALFDISTHLVDKWKNDVNYRNYINAKSDSKVARFRYIFKFDEIEVEYTYEKFDVQTLKSEELYVNNEEIFKFDFKEQKFISNNLDTIEVNTLNWEFRDFNISILRYIANNTNLNDNSVIKKLVRFVSNMLWFRSLDRNSYIGFTNGTQDVVKYIIENNWVQEFEDFLKDSGVDEKLKVIDEPSGEKVLYFDYKRPIRFSEAMSSGTKALTIFYYWLKQFEKVTFLYIDEFDAFYHYALSERIVRIIEESKFQAILTTHNTDLMSNKIMRPDCYLLLTKERITSIIDATDRELREGHNLEKLYKSGEFDV